MKHSTQLIVFIYNFSATGFQLQITLGILYVFIVGSYITWRWLALASAVFPIIMMVAMLFFYESPLYLLSKGKLDEARKSLQYFRGKEVTYIIVRYRDPWTDFTTISKSYKL